MAERLRRPAGNHLVSQRGAAKRRRVALLSAGWLVLLGLVIFSVLYYVQQHLPRFAEEKIILHSPAGGGVVVVPFHLRHGLIHVQASLNGKTTDCIVDTGSAAILCPPTLPITGRQTWCQAVFTDAAGNRVAARQIVIGDLKLGGYELKGMPVFPITGPAVSTGGKRPRTLSDASVILGNSAFAHVILTIDYRHRLLLIRHSLQSTLLVQDPSDGAEYRFTWDDPLPNGTGVILCRGEVSGMPMHFLMDTGYAVMSVGLSVRAVDRLIAAKKLAEKQNERLTTGFGGTGALRANYFKRVTWSLQQDAAGRVAERPFSSPAIEINNHASSSDAIIGYAFLRNYCVTIDYPQQKLFLKQ